MRRVVSLLAVDAALAAAFLAWRPITHAARGPSSWSWTGVSRWYESSPAESIVLTAGLACIGLLAIWLFVATQLQLLAELLPALPRLQQAADRVAPRALRSLGRAMADVTLGAGLLVGPVAAVGAQVPAPTATVAGDTATLTPLEPPPMVPLPVEAAPVAAAVDASVVVQPGDSFWSIADDAVARASGGSATEHAVASYWLALMTANADRLVVPGLFDLLYPGQVLALPALGAAEPGAPVLPETL
jgi:hypothetical protein